MQDQQRALTRRAILQAARALFSTQGYAATSVRALAAEAGVSVQTIYDTFGSKAGVLGGMPDLIDEEAEVHEIVAALQASRDARESLGLFVRLRRRIRERCGDIMATLRSGASVDPQVAAALAEGMRRRRFGLERMMEGLAAGGALKPELTAPRAADMASALVCDEVCDVLVEQQGWSFDEYESWLTDALVTLLLK